MAKVPSRYRAQRAWRDLQAVAVEGRGVVVADLARLLDAEDLAQLRFADGNESRPRLLRLDGEAGVPLREEAFKEVVGGLDVVDALECQLLRQAVLECAEGALGAAGGLRREGGDVFDAELRQRPANPVRTFGSGFSPAFSVTT